MYGVQSFDGSISGASDVTASLPELDSPSVSKPVTVSASPASPQQWSNNLEEDSGCASPETHQSSSIKDFDSTRHNKLDAPFALSNFASPRPLTPLNLLNPDEPSSLPSSPKSISNQSTRHLDEISITDDLSSQAVASGEEDEDSRPTLNASSDTMSQLIMPSITIPDRRPFTDKGKALGRMKLLMAGSSGKNTHG